MARGRKTSLSLCLTPAVRQTLLAWQRATTIPAGRARRGRIILLVADGLSISAVAAMVGISRRFVYKWVRRFLEHGIEGLTGFQEQSPDFLRLAGCCGTCDGRELLQVANK